MALVVNPAALSHVRHHAPRLSMNLSRLCTRASNSHRAYGAGSEAQKPETYGALLLDIGGTLLETSHPVPEVYARIGAKHGVKTTPSEFKKGFKKAFAEPWPARLLYEGDGRPFWRYAMATVCQW